MYRKEIFRASSELSKPVKLAKNPVKRGETLQPKKKDLDFKKFKEAAAARNPEMLNQILLQEEVAYVNKDNFAEQDIDNLAQSLDVKLCEVEGKLLRSDPMKALKQHNRINLEKLLFKCKTVKQYSEECGFICR